MTALLTMPEVATKLRISRRWLQDWLRDNPRDAQGIQHYRAAGRTKLFTHEDLERVRASLIRQATNKSNGTPDAREGYVYFIDGGECIKIGFTRSIETRVRKMLTDAPVELSLLHIEPGTFKQEKLFHREFEALRVRGEWFRKTPELLAFIEHRKRIKAGDVQ